ncbi:hypothetical protein [Mycoavidus sp. B2-EB]|uniref:hypothetical protein n=1 Tax=Mycoavidus sp. B2-EB TaxID=2651972 RepID=UPI00162AF61E|nr:hypothetical protein [Mycoavidus sp. B2-EB]
MDFVGSPAMPDENRRSLLKPVAENVGFYTPPLSPNPGVLGDQSAASADFVGSPAMPDENRRSLLKPVAENVGFYTPPLSPNPGVLGDQSAASADFVGSPVMPDENRRSLLKPVAENVGFYTPPLSPNPGALGDQSAARADFVGSPATPDLELFPSESAISPVTPRPNQSERSEEGLERLAEKYRDFSKLSDENPNPRADLSSGSATPGLGISIGQPLKIEDLNGSPQSSSNPAARHPSALTIPVNGFAPASPGLTPTKRYSGAWPSDLTKKLIGMPSDSVSPVSDRTPFLGRTNSAASPLESPSAVSASTKRNSGVWPSDLTKKLIGSPTDSSSSGSDMTPLWTKGGVRPWSIVTNSAEQQTDLITVHSSSPTASRRLAEASPISPTSEFRPCIAQYLEPTNLAELPKFSYYFNQGADALEINSSQLGDRDYNHIFFDYYFFSIHNPSQQVKLGVYLKSLYKWNFIDKGFSEFNLSNFPRAETSAARLVLVMTNFDFESQFDGVRNTWQRKDYDFDFPILFRRFEDNAWYKYVLTGNQFSWKKIDIDHFDYWLGQGTRFVSFTADEFEAARAEGERSCLTQIQEESAESGNLDE